jgi:hypothetical protein
MLERLKAGAAPESVGDPTMLPYAQTLAPQSEIARSFGEAFADELVKLTPGAWTGPVYSGLGGHLVMVTGRVDGRLPELAQVRGQVEREYLARRREELKDLVYQKLLKGYQVIIAPQPAAGRAPNRPAAASETAQAAR